MAVRSKAREKESLKGFPKFEHGDIYTPAMSITEPHVACRYLQQCVAYYMDFGGTKENAEAAVKQNLGYHAGYYDHETRLRVEKLFDCVHPSLGAASNGQPK
jgi:hypothetical protein